ncbi:aminoglycoside phosphotransferase family protein [Pedobacter aquatilis]|uniref:phosphotransferase enzyme family protein n=1 Tax=Pedobacter aquatilis TaxID=351343 RepID=UPI00292F7B77|nr:aminoglycoside phosphotransferase family protein [Pedobacter aquatilis]
MIEKVLEGFGLDKTKAELKPFGSGLINNTWKISVPEGAYILQKINTHVFSSPKDIADNMLMIKQYLDIVAPKYFFVGPIKAQNGDSVLELDGNAYRLFPYVENSVTIDEVENPDQAYHAAKQFGKFTRMLEAFNPKKLKISIQDFHNLPFRVEQYNQALSIASKTRLEQAAWAIKEIERQLDIVHIFNEAVKQEELTVRVIHHDTKINNVLLDKNSGSGLCVIDLDTVMPGYFISDVGDMMRTYLSPSNEEETDFDNIKIRPEMFAAIYKGYMEEMDKILNQSEKQLFIYSGKFMIFMQALRFLTDFLSGDIYYKISNPNHNLNRAENQIFLLNKYIESEPIFNDIIENRNKVLELIS